MNPFNVLKPEYLYRPIQAWRRLMRNSQEPNELVNLPWGLPIRVRTDDMIGRQIWALGVFELVESEVLWRLTQPGDRCVDVGANIGYTASILACRASITGSVEAYEPHPEVFKDAITNVKLWDEFDIASVDVRPIGLSSSGGRMTLNVPEAFMGNRGLSTFDDNCAGMSIEVEVSTVDSLLGTSGKVGVLKMDVEGHEASVLGGAANSLRNGLIRDVIYEDHLPFPSPVSSIFLNAGYSLFRLDFSWWKPTLVDPKIVARNRRPLTTPNYLATLDPERAIGKLQPFGWQCLSASPVPRKK